MSLIARRRLLTGASLAALARPAAAGAAARFSLRYGNDLPATHPLSRHMAEAAERIARESAGEVAIEMLPNSQAGSDTDMLDMLRLGKLDLFSAPAQMLGELVPVAAITSMAFAFSSYAQVWPALDGALGAHIRQAIEAAGFVVFERIWDSGFHQITARKKGLETLTDIRKLRIRVPNGPLVLAIFLALGAAPAAVDEIDLYGALQAGTFDDQESPLAVVDALKLYEVQHFCSITNHRWDGFWLLGNRAAFSRMPEDLRSIVSRNVNAAAMAQRAELANLNQDLVQQLTDRGMEFNTAIMAPFRAELHNSGFYADWKTRLGLHSWTLLEQATGVLT